MLNLEEVVLLFAIAANLLYVIDVDYTADVLI